MYFFIKFLKYKLNIAQQILKKLNTKIFLRKALPVTCSICNPSDVPR